MHALGIVKEQLKHSTGIDAHLGGKVVNKLVRLVIQEKRREVKQRKNTSLFVIGEFSLPSVHPVEMFLIYNLQ
jgi:hypothetical protein